MRKLMLAAALAVSMPLAAAGADTTGSSLPRATVQSLRAGVDRTGAASLTPTATLALLDAWLDLTPRSDVQPVAGRDTAGALRELRQALAR